MKKRETKKTTPKLKKAVKNSKPAHPSSKNVSRYLTAKNLVSWRQYDPGEKWAEQIADTLLTFAQDESRTSLPQFYEWFGIPEMAYHRLKNKYEVLSEANSLVKIMFGNRRERLAMQRDSGCDPSTIHKTLRIYHPDWRDVHEENKKERADLKNNEKGITGPVTIVIPDQE